MSRYSTRMSSTACFSVSVSSVSVQSNRFKNSVLASISSFGFSFSLSCNSHSSFVFDTGCALLCCQDSRVSGTKKYWLADLVYSFGVAQ